MFTDINPISTKKIIIFKDKNNNHRKLELIYHNFYDIKSTLYYEKEEKKDNKEKRY